MQRLVRTGKAAAEIQGLPLNHHAVSPVVQQEYFYGQVVVRAGFHLAQIHSNTAVTIHVDHDLVRTTHLGAYRRGQAIAHGTHAT